MRLMLTFLACAATACGVVDDVSVSATQQHIDPCTSPPAAPGGDTADLSTSQQCHLQQTHDAAAGSAPIGVASRVTCEVYTGIITCNVTWWGGEGGNECRVISCLYSSFDGLVCSPVGTALPQFCL